MGTRVNSSMATQALRQAAHEKGRYERRGQPKSGGGTGDRGKAETVKNGKWWKTDEVILKPSRRHGERIADILGGEYIDYEEVEIGNQNK